MSVSAQSRIFVRIQPETTIDGDRIELGAVARISGGAAQSALLRAVSLGYAPNVGMMRELSRERINLAIAAAGFAANELTIEAPARIIVRRSAQIVDANILREAVEKAVAERLKTEGINFKIVRLDLPEKVRIPTGGVAVRADLGSAKNIFAPFSVALEMRIDDKVVSRISAMTQIEAFADVLVAAKDLPLGARISETDVTTENRRLQKPLTAYLRDAASLRGLSLTKNLSVGSELTVDALVSTAVIKTGDTVQIQAQSGSLKIILNGEARTSGKIGDRISVRNRESGAILQAVVIDEKIVRVNF